MNQFASVKAGKSAFTVDKDNSEGVMGSETLKVNGGTFNFVISYLTKSDNAESLKTRPVRVIIPA